MAKTYEAPAGIEIAALKQKKAGAMDLMRPGNGTPWEDRGTRGLLTAFVQTCVKSIISPARQMDHIHRPDADDDAGPLARACSVMWGLSAAIHGFLLLQFLYLPDPTLEVDTTYYYLSMLVLALVAPLLAYGLLKVVAGKMFLALIRTELKGSVPRSLLSNLFAYSMGPSLLALLPVAGPPLALVLIFYNWCVAGSKRLYVSWRGTIVAACLTMVAVLLIAGAAWFAGDFVWSNVMGFDPLPEKVIPPPKRGAAY